MSELQNLRQRHAELTAQLEKQEAKEIAIQHDIDELIPKLRETLNIQEISFVRVGVQCRDTYHFGNFFVNGKKFEIMYGFETYVDCDLADCPLALQILECMVKSEISRFETMGREAWKAMKRRIFEDQAKEIGNSQDDVIDAELQQMVEKQ